MLMSLLDLYANLRMGVKRLVAYQDANSNQKCLDTQREAQDTGEIEASRKYCQYCCSYQLECDFERPCSACVAPSIAALCSLLQRRRKPPRLMLEAGHTMPFRHCRLSLVSIFTVHQHQAKENCYFFRVRFEDIADSNCFQ